MPHLVTEKMEGMDIKKICVVGNPISGGGNAPPAVHNKDKDGNPKPAKACHGQMKLPCESFLDAMARLCPEIEVKVVWTEYSGHAAVLAEEAARDGYHIVAAGGDGTMCEANNGLRRAPGCDKMPIGFIGSGTMNFFGINLGQESPVKLAECIRAGTYRDISMAVANDAGGNLPKDEVVTFRVDGGLVPVMLSWQDYFRQTFVGPSNGIKFGFLQGIMSPYADRNHIPIHIKVWPLEGSGEEIFETDIPECFWITVSVNQDHWDGSLQKDNLGMVSWTVCENAMSLKRFSTFIQKGMRAFEMTAGMSYLQENFMHYSKIELTPINNPEGEWNLALDGDPKRVKGTVTVVQKKQSLRMMCMPESAGVPPRAKNYYRPREELGAPTSQQACDNIAKYWNEPVMKPSRPLGWGFYAAAAVVLAAVVKYQFL